MMVQKIFDHAEQLMTRLNRTLTGFEQDFDKIRQGFQTEVDSFKDRVSEELREFHEKTENLDEVARDKLRELEADLKDIFEKRMDEFQGRMNELVDSSTEKITTIIDESFDTYKEAAKKAAELDFETGAIELFKKYSDKLAPVMLKAMLAYLITFGKKSKQ